MSALFEIELNRYLKIISPHFYLIHAVALPGGVGQQRRLDPVERNERIHQPVVQPQHQCAHFGRHGNLR